MRASMNHGLSQESPGADAENSNGDALYMLGQFTSPESVMRDPVPVATRGKEQDACLSEPTLDARTCWPC